MKRSEFLQRVLSVTGLGFLSVVQIKEFQKIYLLQAFVAGFRFHKGMELLPLMQESDVLELRREPANEHDPFAVALYWQQEMIGYLPADSNETIAKLLDAEALPLLAAITHLNRGTRPWENVAVAIFYLHSKEKPLPAGAEYLTWLEEPVYTPYPPKGGKWPTTVEKDEEAMEFSFKIGGFLGDNYKLVLEDDGLFYSEGMYSIEPAAIIDIKENKDWPMLVDFLTVCKWEEAYDSDILDGTQWNLKFRNGEKKIECYGSNNYPADFKELVGLINKIIHPQEIGWDDDVVM